MPKELTPVQLQAIQEDRMNECFVDAFSQSNQDSSVPHGASLEGWSEALETVHREEEVDPLSIGRPLSIALPNWPEVVTLCPLLFLGVSSTIRLSDRFDD